MDSAEPYFRVLVKAVPVYRFNYSEPHCASKIQGPVACGQGGVPEEVGMLKAGLPAVGVNGSAPGIYYV